MTCLGCGSRTEAATIEEAYAMVDYIGRRYTAVVDLVTAGISAGETFVVTSAIAGAFDVAGWLASDAVMEERVPSGGPSGKAGRAKPEPEPAADAPDAAAGSVADV
jgi:hypothetical protein